MYGFRDLRRYTGQDGGQLPAEAVTVDGVQLDTEISGFRTLSVQGRELIGRELNKITVGDSDGDELMNSRYPSRRITVKYELTSATPEEFRTAFKKLNALLAGTEVPISFNDDKTVYFVGTFESADDVPEGRLNVVSELTFWCSKPFAYANVEKTFNSVGNTITVKNNGTYPTPVSFDVENQSDNGFVGLVNKDAIIQIGNPDEIDGYNYSNAEVLLKNAFNSDSELNQWQINKYPPKYWDKAPLTGSFATKTSTNYDHSAYVKDYADGTDKNIWYGPSMYRAFAKDSTGATTYGNFKLNSLVRARANELDTCGVQELAVVDASGKAICGFRFRKMRWTSKNMQLYVFVGDTIINKWEGPTEWIMKDYLGNLTIERNGNNFHFTLNNTSTKSPWAADYYDETMGKVKAAGVNYWCAKAGTMKALDLELFMINVQETVSGWNDVRNMFMEGDLINIDCDDKIIKPYLNNGLVLGIMDIGSRPIIAPPGDSTVTVVASTFASPLKVTARIRERWL